MPTSSAPLAARAVLDLDLPGPTISRHLYGHFAEHLGRCIYGGFYVGEDSGIPNQGGIRLDVVEALKAIGIPNLRWPGGAFAELYRWRDAVGPKDERTEVQNVWGGRYESNRFGTHEFLALCELLGAEPYVNGRVIAGDIDEMRDWVAYITHEDGPLARLRARNGRDRPWPLRFWGVGNEPWGAMTAEHYVAEAQRHAAMVVGSADAPLYKILAGPLDDDLEWTRRLMQTVSRPDLSTEPTHFFDAISLHYYTYALPWHDSPWGGAGSATEFGTDDYYWTIAKAQDIERVIAGHSAVMDSYDPKRRVGLVIDEWGTWWEPEPGTDPSGLYQENTLRDALVASVHFDVFHRHAERISMANIAQTVNVLQAMILTDEAGRMVLTPTYHVFEMNRGHHDARSIAVHLPERPETRTAGGRPLEVLSASASVSGDRALVSASNLDAEQPLELTLDLRGRDVTGYTGRVLTAPRLQERNSVEHPDAVAPRLFTDVAPDPRGLRLTLPPASFVTLSLDLAPSRD